MNEAMTKKNNRTVDAEAGFVLPLWVPMAAFFVLIFLRDLYGVGIPRIVFTALLAVSFFLVKEDYDIALLVSTLAFNTRINYNEITLVFLGVYLLRRMQKLRLPALAFSFLLVLFLELADTLFASGDIATFFRFAVLMLISMFILVFQPKRENLTTIFFSYIIGLAMALVDILVLTFRLVSFDQFFDRGYRLGKIEDLTQSTGTTNFNPNMLAALAAVALYLLFMLWYTKRIHALLAYPMAGFLIFGALLTQGRSMLLALIFFLVFLLFANMRGTKSFLSAFLVIGLFVAAIIILINGPLASLYERYMYRFTMEDVSNGRAEIWRRILAQVTGDFRALFFGYGIKYYADITGGSSAHNTVIEIFASWGLVGFVSIIIFNLGSVKQQIQNTRLFAEGRRIPMIYFGPLAAFLFSLLGTHLYTVTIYSIIFALTQMAIRLCDYDDERKLSFAARRRQKRLKDWQEEHRSIEANAPKADGKDSV